MEIMLNFLSCKCNLNGLLCLCFAFVQQITDLVKLQTLPDDLKTKLSIEDDLVSSPKEALSRASADRRMKYLNRYLLIFFTYLICLIKKLTCWSPAVVFHSHIQIKGTKFYLS
jgi:hypothetical protein